MKVASPDFENGGPLPTTSAYHGDNRRPALKLTDVPESATSLAVIIHDPDAPVGDYTHWLAWNLPPTTDEIPSNNLPNEVIEGVTDFGTNSYGGPAPPSGTHHYHFVVYALDSTLDLPTETTRAELEEAMKSKIIDQAELIGTFSAD